LHQSILNAVQRAFGFSGWPYANEFELEHELFHCLADIVVDGVELTQTVPGTSTRRLHAGGKVVNGNPCKADLLICDPHRRQSFNYEVDRVIELKKFLSRASIAGELKKFSTYARPFEALYLVAPTPMTSAVAVERHNETEIFLLHPGVLVPLTSDGFLAVGSKLSLHEAVTLVRGGDRSDARAVWRWAPAVPQLFLVQLRA
jgi:hypothetical protein